MPFAVSASRRSPSGFRVPTSAKVLGRSPYTLLVDMWNERRFGTRLPRRFQQVQRAERVHLEIEKRDGRGAVVRGLRGGVDDQVRA